MAAREGGEGVIHKGGLGSLIGTSCLQHLVVFCAGVAQSCRCLIFGSTVFAAIHPVSIFFLPDQTCRHTLERAASVIYQLAPDMGLWVSSQDYLSNLMPGSL